MHAKSFQSVVRNTDDDDDDDANDEKLSVSSHTSEFEPDPEQEPELTLYDNSTMVLIQSKITSNSNSTNATELKQMKSIAAKKLYASPPSFQNDWYNTTSCHKPIPYPILGTHDLTRVINVGMPKCGSTSLTRIFTEAHEAFPGGTSHWGCGPNGKCGLCIKNAIEKGKAPLASCGNFDAFMQMDLADNPLDICVFPQIQYLDEIYKENPTATLILAFRNHVTKWVKSIANWKSRAHGPFQDRIANLCEFPNIGFTKSMGGTEEDLIGLACNHVKQVRHFVHDHPTLSLVEIDIDDPNTGNYLATLFPVNSEHWGNENKNPNSH